MNKWGVIGCGWLGLPFAKALVSQGAHVIGTTASNAKIPLLESHNIHPKLLKQQDFFKDWEALPTLDYVLLNIPPSQFKDSYAKAMSNIVEQLDQNCKLIFISSTSVYPNNGAIVHEKSPASGTNRNGPYVAQAEKALRTVNPDHTTILRLAGLVGGDRHPAKFMQGRDIGGANNPVNLVHRSDCLTAINAVHQKNCWGETVNICASDHPKKKVYYKHAAESLNLDTISFNTSPQSYKIVSNQHSKSLLDMEYKYDSPFDFPI